MKADSLMPRLAQHPHLARDVEQGARLHAPPCRTMLNARWSGRCGEPASLPSARPGQYSVGCRCAAAQRPHMLTSGFAAPCNAPWAGCPGRPRALCSKWLVRASTATGEVELKWGDGPWLTAAESAGVPHLESAVRSVLQAGRRAHTVVGAGWMSELSKQ